MLSINIPVYNFDVSVLVEQLLEQGKQLGIDFEIRVYDDGSDPAIKQINQKIRDLEHVVYVELEQNMGRSAIRNKMGFDAEFDYLLFIDADSAVVSNTYLKDYLRALQSNCVLCGGTAYHPTQPAEPEKLLRYVYVTNREAIAAELRNAKKGCIITSNNFLIEKEVFKNIHFREDLTKYGHEDTVLGFDLYSNGIKINHLNNPLEHTGLEASSVFIEKTKVALENLFFIQQHLLGKDSEFSNQVHFLKKYRQIKRVLPKVFLKLFYHWFGQKIQQNLLGPNPKLFWFDVYKVSYYSTLQK